jgi:hypothetical protein
MPERLDPPDRDGADMLERLEPPERDGADMLGDDCRDGAE